MTAVITTLKPLTLPLAPIAVATPAALWFNLNGYSTFINLEFQAPTPFFVINIYIAGTPVNTISRANIVAGQLPSNTHRLA